MGTANNRIAHMPFRLNAAKIKRAQKLMQAGTETETIEQALDAVITEHERNEAAREANERFIKSGVVIRDVYGTLEKIDGTGR
jgi:SOS response regulatory protein OraA/RecX